MVSAFPKPDDPGLDHLPTIDFCSDWNPEFPFNGHRCCRSIASIHKRKTRVSCFSHRPREGYCDEVTDDQKKYIDELENPDAPDALALIEQDMGRREQAYCTANNGFLAFGRPIVPSDKNRIRLRAPQRCTEFGTDNMVGMLEWLGRQVATHYSGPEYSGVHVLLGDVSAPRGGCLSGPSGIHGHLSHTNGSDADVGLLNVKKNVRSPASFSTHFDARANWWFIKQVLNNPFACVKVIFLDRRHIRSLSKVAWNDPDWAEYHRFIRHVPGHKNHMHVRVGDHPGKPGCYPGANPDLEEEAEIDGENADQVMMSQMSHPGDPASVSNGSSDPSSTKSSAADSASEDEGD